MYTYVLDVYQYELNHTGRLWFVSIFKFCIFKVKNLYINSVVEIAAYDLLQISFCV